MLEQPRRRSSVTVSVANDPHPFEYHRRSRTDPEEEEEDEREIRYVHILRGLVTRTCRRRRTPQRETSDYRNSKVYAYRPHVATIFNLLIPMQSYVATDFFSIIHTLIIELSN